MVKYIQIFYYILKHYHDMGCIMCALCRYMYVCMYLIFFCINIATGFAASFSIVTSCILCYFVFDFHPNLLFLSGAILVNVSMYMYSFGPDKVKMEKAEDLPGRTSSTDSGNNSASDKV